MNYQVTYGYSFVKDVLVTSLQPTKPANFPYSSDVVRRLIQAGVVSSSMLDSNLLTVLRLRNDWVRLSRRGIEHRLTTTIDLHLPGSQARIRYPRTRGR